MATTNDTRRTTRSSGSRTKSDLNLVVLCGTIAGAPTTRSLASGETVLQFDLRCRPVAAPPTSVPVAWHDPTASARRGVEESTHVVVLGWARQRFFRAGGVTCARTEVVASRVVPSRRRTAVTALVGAAVDLLRSR